MDTLRPGDPVFDRRRKQRGRIEKVWDSFSGGGQIAKVVYESGGASSVYVSDLVYGDDEFYRPKEIYNPFEQESPEQMEQMVMQAAADMPAFRDEESGELWVWDPTSHSYVQKHDDDFAQPSSWQSGGDNHILDPARHRMTPKNPDATGILASTFNQCEQCGNHLEQDGTCPRCTKLAEEFQDIPVQHYPSGPFPGKAPRPNMGETDNSFPTRITHHENGQSRDVTVDAGGNVKHQFSHVDEEYEYHLAHDGPNLNECPDCAGPMGESNGEKVCRQCGSKQPIINVEAAQKESFAMLAPLAGGLARAVLPMLGRGAAGAGAGEAAGGAAAAEGAGGASKGLAGQLMNGAMTPGPLQASQLAGGLPEEPTSNPAAQQPVLQEHMAAGIGDDNDDVFSDEEDDGRDDVPGEETQGFNEQHGDSPELLKDVNDAGGTDQGADALKTFENSLPLVLFYAESEDSGEHNPVLKALDQLLESAFPGYRNEGESNEDHKEKAAMKQSNDFRGYPEAGGVGEACAVCGAAGACPHKPAQNNQMEGPGVVAGTQHEAVRRPKMCPFHSDLVEYSLEFGDPQAALGALTPSGYGEAYCKSGGFEGSCNFKPAMVTQKYWDDKATQAEERRLQREQEAQQQAELLAEPESIEGELGIAEPVDDFDAGIDVGFEGVDHTDDAGATYHTMDDAPSAVGAPMAAKTADTRTEDDHVWKDEHGQPLRAGHEYLMKSAEYAIPERITVDEVTPEKLTYTNHTGQLEFRDVLTRLDIQNEQLHFVSTTHQAEHEDETHDGAQEQEHEPHTEVETAPNDAGLVPLSHLSMTAAVNGEIPYYEDRAWLLDDDTQKTAGKDFSATEQREFINEAGTARNLDRLDLSGTHYPDMDEAEIINSHSTLW